MFSAALAFVGFPTQKVYVKSIRYERVVFPVYITSTYTVQQLIEEIGDLQENERFGTYGSNCDGIYAPAGVGGSMEGRHVLLSEDRVIVHYLTDNSRQNPIYFNEVRAPVPCIWVQAHQPDSEPYHLDGISAMTATVSELLSAIRAHQGKTFYAAAYGRPVKSLLMRQGEGVRELYQQYERIVSTLPGYHPNSASNPLLYATGANDAPATLRCAACREAASSEGEHRRRRVHFDQHSSTSLEHCSQEFSDGGPPVIPAHTSTGIEGPPPSER